MDSHSFFQKLFNNTQYFRIMKNSQIQITKPAEQIYQVIIDGIVHRGTRAEIQQIIAHDRENPG